MNKPLTKPELAALSSLIEATGLTYTALAKRLDIDPLTLSRWVNGERPPNHPAMIKKALQLIVLEQKGVITDKLIEHATKCKAGEEFFSRLDDEDTQEATSGY